MPKRGPTTIIRQPTPTKVPIKNGQTIGARAGRRQAPGVAHLVSWTRELLWPPEPIGPVQPRTEADERDASVKDGVTAEMHDVLIAKRSYEAEDLSTKNENGTRQRESEGHR